MASDPSLGMEFHPLTAERWPDLVDLFDRPGDPGSCWCRYWRETAETWRANDREGRRRVTHAEVRGGTPTGVLAYRDGRAIGWCSVAPREAHGRVEATPAVRRVDDRPTWSVTCFVVRRGERRQGLTRALLESAVAYAAANGAEVVEGYPVERHVGADGRPIGAPFRYMGDSSIYRAAGFRDVALPGRVRRFMRLRVR
jgi:GNAT superfamily N-acetyltransferase